jgi:hypothetical protein
MRSVNQPSDLIPPDRSPSGQSVVVPASARRLQLRVQRGQRSREGLLDLAARVVRENLVLARLQPVVDRGAMSRGSAFGTSRPAMKGVSVYPRCAPSRYVFCSSSSTRSALLNDQNAALVAEWSPVASQLSTECTLMMAPPSFRARTGANAWVTATCATCFCAGNYGRPIRRR